MHAASQAPFIDVPARVSLQERKQEFARNAIWDSAIDLFFEKGFDETTVDEIAARAGTSRRSFFRHFESKSGQDAQSELFQSSSKQLSQSMNLLGNFF